MIRWFKIQPQYIAWYINYVYKYYGWQVHAFNKESDRIVTTTILEDFGRFYNSLYIDLFKQAYKTIF